MTHINRLYGILTNGDTSQRNTNGNRYTLSPTCKQIVEALIPPSISKAGARGLAEIYIRLCQADEEASALLSRVDPTNTYNITSFSEAFNDNLSLADIVLRIKLIGLPNEENSFLPVDYIVNALKHLLGSLDATD